MPTKPQCRLTIYMAPAARRAVILRRGPSKWFHLILWHMQSDEFEHGSWFSGRIYEDRCDLSPDGRFFAYFAANQSWHIGQEIKPNAWSAICQPPWLKALEFSPSSCGTYGTGGVFVTPRDPEFGDAHAFSFLPPDVRLSYGKLKRHQAPIECLEADWIGLDQKSRVVFTKAGELWRCANLQGELKNPQFIADFTDLAPPKRGTFSTSDA